MLQSTLNLARENTQEKLSRAGWLFWLRVSAPLAVMFLLLTAGLLAGRVSNVRAEKSGVVPDAPGSISGVVRDMNGAPVANIAVYLYRRSGQGGFTYSVQGTTTATDGSYEFILLSAGIFRIRFSDPARRLSEYYFPNSYTMDDAQDIPVAGDTVTNVNVTLPLAGGIRGSITVTPTRVDQQYLLIAAMQKQEDQWETKFGLNQMASPMTPTVSYTMTGLTPGVYKVCVYDYYTGYYPFYRCYDDVATDIEYANNVTVTSGVTVTGIDIIVGGGNADLASISGKVTSLAGTALQGVTVELLSRPSSPGVFGGGQSYTTRTASTGAYRFDRVFPGSYIVHFFHNDENYVQEYYDDVGHMRVGTPITVTRLEKRTNIDASLAVGGVITGVVTVLGGNQGFYPNISLLPVEYDGYFCCQYSLAVENTGRYRINRIPPGNYRVYANAYTNSREFFVGYYGGATYETARVVSVTGAVTIPNINIDLAQGAYEAAIAGRVTNSNRQPLAGILVEFYRDPYDQESFFYTSTDTEGRYSIGGLLDGYYYVGFRDPQEIYGNEFYSGALRLAEATQLFTAGAEPLTQVNVSLLQPGGITGRAIYTNDAPAPNVQISLFTVPVDRGIVGTAFSDARGVYQIDDLRPGAYVIQFQDQNYPTENPFGMYVSYYHQRRTHHEADRVDVYEGEMTVVNDQVIGGAPTALDVENEPQAPASLRMYLPLVAR